MEMKQEKLDQLCINTLRFLSIDQVEKAGSLADTTAAMSTDET